MYFCFLVHLSVVKEPEKSLKSSWVSVSSAASCSWHTAALKAFLPRFGAAVVVTNQDETYVYMEGKRDPGDVVLDQLQLGSGQLGRFRRSHPSQLVLRNLVVGEQPWKSMQPMWTPDRSCCYWERQIINKCNRNETTQQSGEKTLGLCEPLEGPCSCFRPVGVPPVLLLTHQTRTGGEPVLPFIDADG